MAVEARSLRIMVQTYILVDIDTSSKQELSIEKEDLKNASCFFTDGNVFLRDLAHAGTEMIPSYNTTSKWSAEGEGKVRTLNLTSCQIDTGILFQTQKSSVISNNIFG